MHDRERRVALNNDALSGHIKSDVAVSEVLLQIAKVLRGNVADLKC